MTKPTCKIFLPSYVGLLFLLLFNNFVAYSQLTLAGRVVSGETGLPIAGASVYFNNTSIGTSSNEKGEFAFNSIDIINTELIVSNVGYEILVLRLNAARANGKFYLCQLTRKAEQMKDVLILSDARRKKMLALFKDNFLGLTQEADRSSIRNLNSIYFTRGATRSAFIANSDTPLVITNNLLGYRVRFELIEFSYDEASGITYFYGYTRYEEMGEKKRWTKKRRQTYFGSTLHFYRSLIKNKLVEDGFDLYVVKPMRMDSISSAEVAVTATAAQVITSNAADSGYYRITVPGKMMIQYKKNPPSKNYLSRKLMIQGNLPIGFRAYIHLSESSFLVDQNGIVANPMAINYSGYWIYEKAANMLPYNYQPD